MPYFVSSLLRIKQTHISWMVRTCCAILCNGCVARCDGEDAKQQPTSIATQVLTRLPRDDARCMMGTNEHRATFASDELIQHRLLNDRLVSSWVATPSNVQLFNAPTR